MARHILKDPKSGNLSYRRAYPEPLRPFVPDGARQLKRSLGSKSLSDSKASRIYAEAQAEFERTVRLAKLRKAAASPGAVPKPLTAADIPFLVGTYAHSLRENLQATHFDRDDSRRVLIATEK